MYPVSLAHALVQAREAEIARTTRRALPVDAPAGLVRRARTDRPQAQVSRGRRSTRAAVPAGCSPALCCA